MKLQPIIEENIRDVSAVYTFTRGWRAREKLNEPKSLAPRELLIENTLPITTCPVSFYF